MTDPLHRCTVEADWVDYNGHMRDAYYVLIFSAAIDDLMDRIGLDAAYRERTKGTLYTAELHIGYFAEVSVDERVAVNADILWFDSKRLHLMLEMRREHDGKLSASQDIMLLHVDQSAGPKVAPFPQTITDSIERLVAENSPAAPAALEASCLRCTKRGSAPA